MRGVLTEVRNGVRSGTSDTATRRSGPTFFEIVLNKN